MKRLAFALAALFIVGEARAGQITYSLTGGGTITTDGKLGLLSVGDISSWQYGGIHGPGTVPEGPNTYLSIFAQLVGSVFETETSITIGADGALLLLVYQVNPPFSFPIGPGRYYVTPGEIVATAIPEPSSIVLAGLGLTAVMIARRRPVRRSRAARG